MGNLWEFIWDSWKCMEIHRFFWEIYVNSQRFMGIHGNVWEFIGIQEI